MISIAVVICVVSIAATLVGRYFQRIIRFRELLGKISGPPLMPVIGNCFDVWGGLDHFYNIIHKEWPSKYGEIFHMALGSQHYVAISSPELIETILKSPTCIDKGDNYEGLRSWLGDGLLLSAGRKWKSRRKLLTPAFHYQILSNFTGTFYENSVTLCDVLKERCPIGEKREIDISPLAARCSLDIICECAMGIRINAQREDSKYVKAIERIVHIVVERFKHPWLISDAVFSLSSLGREHEKLLKIVHDFTDLVISKRRKELDGNQPLENQNEAVCGLKNVRPFLDLLLEARVDGKELNQNDIREEVNTFMFEGHDTVAASMSWFFYCMAANLQQQEKVWMELEEVFGGSDRECTLQDLPKLKYLECCIKETMRFYPSVSVVTRFLTEDLQLGDYLIPAGANVGVLISATHHNPRIYPNPSTFNPDRFLIEETKSRHPFAYIPFSAGPRNCIGQRFALIEEKVVLATVMRQFRFELTSDKPIPSLQTILKSLNGIKLLVSRR